MTVQKEKQPEKERGNLVLEFLTGPVFASRTVYGIHTDNDRKPTAQHRKSNHTGRQDSL